MENKLDRHLLEFRDEINRLNASNVVIGGSFALQLHGLNVWAPADLDLVIYSATQEQRDLVENLGFKPDLESYDDDEKIRSWKMVRINETDFFNDFHLNVLLEDKPNPEGLLYYMFLGKTYRVNSVKNIVEAKRFYVSEGTEKHEGHLKLLKTLNFNLNEKEDKYQETIDAEF